MLLLQLTCEAQTAVSIQESLRQLLRLGLKSLLIPFSECAKTHNQRGDITLEDLAEQRQHVEPKLVAARTARFIAGILTKTKAMLTNVVINVRATPAKQRAQQREAMPLIAEKALVLHSRKPSDTRSPADIGQDGLGLIIRMMSQINVLSPVLHRHLAQKFMAQQTSSCLDGKTVRFAIGGGIRLPNFTDKSVLLRQTPDKSRILSGLTASQPMVEMTDHEVLMPLADEPM